jgi:hypothetical protein
MKKSLLFASLLVFLTPIISKAQSSIDGNWKFDLNKMKMPEKPDVYLLQDGMYHCKTCLLWMSKLMVGIRKSVVIRITTLLRCMSWTIAPSSYRQR